MSEEGGFICFEEALVAESRDAQGFLPSTWPSACEKQRSASSSRPLSMLRIPVWFKRQISSEEEATDLDRL
jgi:hypothetical protein